VLQKQRARSSGKRLSHHQTHPAFVLSSHPPPVGVWIGGQESRLMRAVFADAGYWLAIANSRDRLHARAAALAERLGEYRIVTSEMVLMEGLKPAPTGS
jgi:hypothetical protein